MPTNKKVVRRLNWAAVTWAILLLCAIIFYFVAISFVVFPTKYKLPFASILVLIIAIMGIFSLRKSKKKSSKKIAVTIINCILCAAMVAGTVYLPILQSKMKGLFVEPSKTTEVKINAYVLTSDYKAAHTDIFANTTSSDSLEDYKNAKFITQSKVDQDNQSVALEGIQNKLGVNALNLLSKEDVMSAVASLYDGTGDVLVLNEQFVATIEEVPGYEKFATDTKIIDTETNTVEVAAPTPSTDKNYTNSSFMVFIAGSDSRDTELTQYTRTDVDMLMTVDPVNHQILLISMPRDWYVKNPALWNGYDKLTHLGNNGMQNSIDGLNQEYGFDYISDYFEVNFVTFKNIIDGLGGIDINNPYEFTDEGGDYFPAGEIHLDGTTGLAYVRERHNLSNGDYGRNEHQAIVLQGIISKMTSKEVISNFSSLLENLQGNFLTSISSDNIYALAEKQLNDGGSWKMISYHLGGVGDYNSTASMGDMQLYVSYPIAEQVTFAKEQMTKVMNGETITQETLPADDQTVYLPN